MNQFDQDLHELFQSHLNNKKVDVSETLGILTHPLIILIQCIIAPDEVKIQLAETFGTIILTEIKERPNPTLTGTH